MTIKINIFKYLKLCIGFISLPIILTCLFTFGTFPFDGNLQTLNELSLFSLFALLFYQICVGERNCQKISLALLVLSIIEMLFFEFELGEFRIGYTSHLLLSIYLIIPSKSQKNTFSILDNKLFLLSLFTVIFYISVSLNGGFSTGNPRNVLGDEITTWFLGGWDQSCNYRMVKQIVSWEWFPGGYKGGYYYPLGYPILASFFHLLYPDNPFLLVNLGVLLISILLFHKVLRQFLNPLVVLAILLLLFSQTPINNLSKNFSNILLFPWNNNIAILSSFVFLYLLISKEKISTILFFLAGICYGVLFASRYGDILYFLPLAIGIIIKGESLRNLKSIVLKGLIFSGGVLLIIIPTLISHKLSYGNYLSTYNDFNSIGPESTFFPALFDIKVHFFKFLELFLFPYLGSIEYNHRLSGFLSSMPYVLFLFLGIHSFYKLYSKETICILLFLLFNYIFFTSTGATTAEHLKYGCFRYFTPMIPFLIFFSFYGLKTWLEKSTFLEKRRNVIVSGTGIIILASVIIFSINKDRSMLHPYQSLNVTYKGKKDLVTKKKYPNYGTDGEEDMVFELNINSFAPLSIYKTSIIYLDGKGESWVTTYPNNTKSEEENLWGIGITNIYGRKINYSYLGDKYAYRNYYLPDDKKLLAYLPIAYPMEGKFIVTIETNLGKLTQLIETIE